MLKKYPPSFIYEPWKAPLSVQKAAGCIIGRIINFINKETKKNCILFFLKVPITRVQLLIMKLRWKKI